MARLFDNASGEYLYFASALASSYPFTMAAWFYADEALDQSIVEIEDADGGGSDWHRLRLNDSPQEVRAGSFNGGSTDPAIAGATYSLNTWHHACGVWAAANDRRVYIDGGNEGTATTTSINPTNLDQTTIGNQVSTGTWLFSGRIAEVMIWAGVALSASEVKGLWAAASSKPVQFNSLTAYLTLLDDQDVNLIDGTQFTAVNTPSLAGHPPVVPFGIPQPSFVIPSAAAAGSILPQMIQQGLYASNRL